MQKIQLCTESWPKPVPSVTTVLPPNMQQEAATVIQCCMPVDMPQVSYSE